MKETEYVALNDLARLAVAYDALRNVTPDKDTRAAMRRIVKAMDRLNEKFTVHP